LGPQKKRDFPKGGGYFGKRLLIKRRNFLGPSKKILSPKSRVYLSAYFLHHIKDPLKSWGTLQGPPIFYGAGEGVFKNNFRDKKRGP